jgi:hypothetical protein
MIDMLALEIVFLAVLFANRGIFSPGGGVG